MLSPIHSLASRWRSALVSQIASYMSAVNDIYNKADFDGIRLINFKVKSLSVRNGQSFTNIQPWLQQVIMFICYLNTRAVKLATVYWFFCLSCELLQWFLCKSTFFPVHTGLHHACLGVVFLLHRVIFPSGPHRGRCLQCDLPALYWPREAPDPFLRNDVGKLLSVLPADWPWL